MNPQHLSHLGFAILQGCSRSNRAVHLVTLHGFLLVFNSNEILILTNASVATFNIRPLEGKSNDAFGLSTYDCHPNLMLFFTLILLLPCWLTGLYGTIFA